MRARVIAVALLFALQAPFALSAELAKITSWDYGTSDVPELITVIVADADGNLRIEDFGVNSEATSSGGKIEMKYTRGNVRDVMIFQAKERRMLVFDRGQCRVMDTQTPGGSGMPAMPAIPPDAMAQMQEAIAQMEKENPELAKMMKQQANASNMLGAMVQQPRETIIEETGDDRTIGDYDTTGFKVYEEGAENDATLVWAADIDDVEGGRLVGNAMAGFLGAYQDMMDNMGAGGLGATGTASAIIEKMKDYYPIETKDGRIRTVLVKAETGGEAEFFPDCQ